MSRLYNQKETASLFKKFCVSNKSLKLCSTMHEKYVFFFFAKKKYIHLSV